jgi:hypothetical protein
MVPLILGGMALAQGIMGAFAGASEAKAKAMSAEIQQRNENFRAQWQNEANNRNQMRQFQAALERNRAIELGATRERALAELYLDRSFSNQKSTLSKQTAQASAAFNSTMTGRGMGSQSGTARALMRQNMEALGANMLALKTNYKNAYRDIESQQAARLSQRADTSWPQQTTFIPNKQPIIDSSSSALTTGLISAGLGGAAAGYSAQLSYGWGGGGGGMGNGSDASLSSSALASRQAMRGF